ncbi:MAG: M20/M25/M40 family metallo-hydrolase [Steroidobacteraceae bacterium]|nr:M20/M25/M40 family metallo-hydrolase [Steroidobacteraceae bacterium]MBP9129667.1 M20/M25/M40 family metallo-hydrolase [Steroidobacteraceae bacterium]
MRLDRHLMIGCAAALFVTFATAPASAASQHPGHDKVVAAIKADQAAAIERLRAWIALPTIANMGVNTPQGAEYMRQLALDAGFQQAKVVESGGVPGVFATLDAGAKHMLAIYFMYDVKHFDPAEWSSPPLEGKIVERPGEGQALVGRGAVNQKGPQMAFLTALHAFKDAGVKLPVNLVLVAEGEEEIGSTNFPTLLADPEIMAALQRSVGVMMPSTGQARDGSMSLDLGAKGVIEVQLISSGDKWGRGPAKDVHSSLMARVDSPAWHLVKALDTLVADDGFTPTVDGWFENVRPLTPREKELLAASLPKDEEAVKKVLGVRHWIKDEDFLTSTYRLASQPTVNIQGLVSGYTGPGGKTVLPGRAEAKLDFRLVPDMTKDEAVEKLKAHLAKRGFGDIEVIVSGGYSPTESPEDSVVIQAGAAALKKAGIDYSLFPRRAGSWPGVVFTGPPLKMAAGHFGVGRGGGAHAPDEWLLIESSDPRVAGYAQQAQAFVDYLYEVAPAAKARH